MYDFSRLDRYLDTFEQIGIPLADLCIMQNHKIIYHKGVGYADAAKTRKMCGDDMMWLFSTTKVITCTAAMRLVERGELSLDDTLDQYFPEYARMQVQTPEGLRPARRKITIRDLFAMTAGFRYKPMEHAFFLMQQLKMGPAAFAAAKDTYPEPSIYALLERGRITLSEFVHALADVPLYFEPSTHFEYSICHDVLGAVIEKVSGMRLGEYMQKYLFDPIGMPDTSFHLEDSKKHRLTAGYKYINVSNTSVLGSNSNSCSFNLTPDFESGGAGLCSTVNDYIKLADALACGGTAANGYELLKPKTVAMMTKNELCPSALDDFTRGQAGRSGYGWGLCGRVHMNPLVSLSPSPVGEFGWDGAACTYALVDAENKLSLFFGTYIMGENNYLSSKVHPQLRDLMYEAIQRHNRVGGSD